MHVKVKRIGNQRITFFESAGVEHQLKIEEIRNSSRHLGHIRSVFIEAIYVGFDRSDSIGIIRNHQQVLPIWNNRGRFPYYNPGKLWFHLALKSWIIGFGKLKQNLTRENSFSESQMKIYYQKLNGLINLFSKYRFLYASTSIKNNLNYLVFEYRRLLEINLILKMGLQFDLDLLLSENLERLHNREIRIQDLNLEIKNQINIGLPGPNVDKIKKTLDYLDRDFVNLGSNSSLISNFDGNSMENQTYRNFIKVIKELLTTILMERQVFNFFKI